MKFQSGLERLNVGLSKGRPGVNRGTDRVEPGMREKGLVACTT